MNAEKLAKIEEIYHAVLDVSVRERVSFLADACGDDEELRREVQSLIIFAELPSDLIDKSPTDVAAEMVEGKKRSDTIGKQVGHYKILSQIGEGGMGEVFLARDITLERNAAIKFIRPEFAQDPDQLRRFLREAKTASSLNHPNIITVYEIGETQNRQFIATEFIEGKTLRHAFTEGLPELEDVLGIALQIATALHAAHTAGIFHRDIKPENIMLREDKLVKILDFGLAKLFEKRNPDAEIDGLREHKKTLLSSSTATLPGMVLGTASYMSPEQAQIKEIDARSDIWSLGVVIYEMLAGHKPFPGQNSGEIIDSILNHDPPPIKKMPGELNRIIKKALQKNADKRYQSAIELFSDLNDFKSDFTFETELIHTSVFPFGSSQTFSNQPAPSTRPDLPAKTGEILTSTGTTSIAEYVFKEVRNHRVFSLGFTVVLFIAITATTYFYFDADSQDRNSIAVMPFVNVSGKQDVEYLSDGISESLINSLSQLSGVKVIAASSTFKYKGKDPDTDEIFRALGVKFILNGRVVQKGDQLQISAELIDTGDKTRVWGEQFNRKMEDLLNIELELSQKIARQMKIHLTPGEKEQLVKAKKIDPQAYELFLKARFYESKSTFEGSQKAVDFYNRALAIDPNYAQAYAALANRYLYIGLNGFKDPKEMMPKARAAIQRALEIDDNLAEVHLVMAGIRQTDWDWTGAEREYERALELNPNLAAIYFKYGFFLTTQGRFEQANSVIQRGRELNPLKPNIYFDIGYIYYFARQYELAKRQYEIGRELNPNFGPLYYGEGMLKSATGHYSEAIADYKVMLRLSGDHTGVKCFLGFAMAKTGRIHEAKEILRELKTGDEYVSNVELAVLYIGLGEQGEALSALERAYAERDSQLQFLGIDPHFDILRDKPRFISIMQRIGLPYE